MRRLAFVALSMALALPGCGKNREVTVYCALDQVFAEPLLRDFEAETGIRVNAVFDIEANKTVGLVRTLLEEKPHPQCDVFWNNELAQTIQLQNAGVLAPYASPAALGIPAEFRDPSGFWTGFAGRARVLIVNTSLVPEAERPSSIDAFLDPRWKGRCAIAKPLTGTTLTHMAALFSSWGEQRALRFCQGLIENAVGLAQGNAHVAKLVARGEYAFGLTDTDDYHERVAEGAPVAAVYPDASGDGTLLIPNSLALIAGAPNAREGKMLIDWMLRPEVEARLAAGPSAQIPLRPGVARPKRVLAPEEFRVLDAHWKQIAQEIERRASYFRETFAR